ncbi:MAG TPA: hypothetical protein VFE51_01785 [Verrucomicrobiae bacterium]|nr:hypothetical protein [Verrucomicrobiae bacterium]
MKLLCTRFGSAPPALRAGTSQRDVPTKWWSVDIVPSSSSFQLDFAERYRNLPFLGVLHPQVYEEQANA